MDQSQLSNSQYGDQDSPPARQSFFKQMQNQGSDLMKSVSTSVKNTIDLVQKKIDDHLKEPPIIIQVCDPMTKDSGLSKHTIYNLKGQDRIGSFDVFRRFNDFHAMREYLILCWPGCVIPPIPEKQMGQGNDLQVVQDRKRQLDYFCKALGKIPFIYYSNEFSELFLRSSGQDIAKLISNLPKPCTQEIVERFRQTFSTLDFRENNGEHGLVISTDQGSLKKNVINLRQYVDQGYSLSQSRRLLNENKVKLFTNLLPEYERQCQLEYYGGNEFRLVVANSDNIALNETIQKLRDVSKVNPLDLVYDLMKIELRECEAMIFTISQREQYISLKNKLEQKVREDKNALSQLSQGKQNLTTITSSVMKSKDEAQLKLESKITNVENQKEVDLIVQLVDMITAILAKQELPKYKLSRVQHYRSTFKSIQIEEAQTYQCEQVLWEQMKNLSSNLSEMRY